MVVESHWFAVAAFSMIFTLGWLFVEKRVTTTAMLAAAGWSFCAFTAQSLTRITQTGAEVSVPAGSLAYFCIALALVSLLALVLYRFGLYPPTDDQPANGSHLDYVNDD